MDLYLICRTCLGRFVGDLDASDIICPHCEKARDVMPDTLFVLAVGNPCDGFTFYGPTDREAAEKAAESYDNTDWWIMPLHRIDQR